MSHVHTGPLANYNSLTDPSLASFFRKPLNYRQLKKSGLIKKNGEIISESTYRINMARSEHKKHVKDMLAQAIVHKTLDMERTRQVAIKKKLEEIAKIELVRRVRDGRGNHGDEDILPFLSSRPRSSRTRSRPSSVPSGKSRGGRRPRSAPSRKRPTSGKSVENETEETIYLDEDGIPISPRSASPGSPQQGGRGRKVKKSPYPKERIDDRHLYSLNRQSLQEYTNSHQMEDDDGPSPYTLPQIGLHEPAPPKKKGGGHRRGRRTVQPTDSQGRPIKSKRFSNKVSTSDDAQIQGSLMLHRSEPAMKHQERVQTLCDVTMHYFGSNIQLDYEKFDPRDEITIEQQHCGGNTLIVFREKIEPRSDFTFVSRRHRGYPFSLTFYINGVLDCRLSVCCEYKHKAGSRLTGKLGHFGVVGVEGAAPCYRCQIGEEMKQRESRKKKKASKSTDYDNDFEDEEEEEDQDGQSTTRTKSDVPVKGEGDDTRGRLVEISVQDDPYNRISRDEKKGQLLEISVEDDPDDRLSRVDEEDCQSGDEEQLPWKQGKVPETDSGDSESDDYSGETETLSVTQSGSHPSSPSQSVSSKSGSRSSKSGSRSSKTSFSSRSDSSSGSETNSRPSSAGGSDLDDKNSKSNVSRSPSPSDSEEEKSDASSHSSSSSDYDSDQESSGSKSSKFGSKSPSDKGNEKNGNTSSSSSSPTSDDDESQHFPSHSQSSSVDQNDDDDDDDDDGKSAVNSRLLIDGNEKKTSTSLKSVSSKGSKSSLSSKQSGPEKAGNVETGTEETHDASKQEVKTSNSEDVVEEKVTDHNQDDGKKAESQSKNYSDDESKKDTGRSSYSSSTSASSSSGSSTDSESDSETESETDSHQETEKGTDDTPREAEKEPEPQQEESKPEPVSTYKVTVKTSDKIGSGTDANVYIILFGNEKESGVLHLKSSSLNKDPFESGHTDIFTFPDISQLGEIQKVRVWHDNKGRYNAWHLEEIMVEDVTSNVKYTFPCDRWLSDSDDDKEISRDLTCNSAANVPVSKPVGTTYKVSVKTSDKSGAGTDANVYIIMYGAEYDSGELHLKKSDLHKDPFEYGHTDVFTFSDMASLGAIHKVKIWHDNKGRFNSWHLNQVEVEDVATNVTYTFPCDRWLSDSDDDKEISRDLTCDSAANVPVSKPVGTTYKVSVKTSDKSGAGTDANVYIIMYGAEYDSGELHLKKSDLHKDPFEYGHTDVFTFSDMASLGAIHKVKIWHDNKGRFNSWHLNQVEVEDVATNVTYTFPCDRWLSDSDDDNQTCRELECSNLPTSSASELKKEEVEKSDKTPVHDDANRNLEIPQNEQESYSDQQELSRRSTQPDTGRYSNDDIYSKDSERAQDKVEVAAESNSDSDGSNSESESDSEKEAKEIVAKEKESEAEIKTTSEPDHEPKAAVAVVEETTAGDTSDSAETNEDKQVTKDQHEDTIGKDSEEEENEEEEEEGMGEPRTEEMIRAAEAIGNMAEPDSKTPRSHVDTSRSDISRQDTDEPVSGASGEAPERTTDEDPSKTSEEESGNTTLKEMEDELQKVLEKQQAQESTSPESNGENGSNETSHDSDSSDSDSEESKQSQEGQKDEEPASARFHDLSTADESENEAPTATDDEDQAGGNDPDRVADNGTPRATQLSMLGVTPGEKIDGSIRDKVEGKKDVELTSIALSKSQVSELAEIIKQNRRVENLVLRNSNLDDEDMETLAKALSETEADDLKMLNLNCNEISPEGVKHVVSILCHKPELEILLLHGSPLGDDGVKTFVEGLSDIHFSGAATTPEKMSAIKDTAKQIVSNVLSDALQSSSLESVAASEGSGGSQNTQIAELLAVLQEQEEEVMSGLRLQQLDLGDCKMTDVGAVELARLITLKSSITTLNLTGNKDVSAEGWKCIAEALKVNKTITVLSLDYNNLGDSGVQLIADMLAQNTTLKSVDLEGNKIGEEGAIALLEALRSNTSSSVRDITLMPRNNIPESIISEIKQLLADRPQ